MRLLDKPAAREPRSCVNLEIKMSKRRLLDEARWAIHKSGGSTRTKKNREKTVSILLQAFLKKLNIQLVSFKKLKINQIRRYVEYRKDQGVKLRSLQNELADIRQILRALGRDHFADLPEMSNASLGISGASREGTHRVLTEMQYHAARAVARVFNPGMASCVELQRELGLRAEEAIRSGDSLNHWLTALIDGKPGTVLHGTKGGRPRHLAPVDTARAIEVVTRAAAVAKVQGGRLVQAPTLKSADGKYMTWCARIGLKGEYSSHSLRCSYAQDRFAFHLENFKDRHEALAATAMDLGHGDGRGRYVERVYLSRPPRQVHLAVELDLDKLINSTKEQTMNSKYTAKREQFAAARRAVNEKARAECKRIDAEIAKLNAQEKAETNEFLRSIKKMGLTGLERPEVRAMLQSLLATKPGAQAGDDGVNPVNSN